MHQKSLLNKNIVVIGGTSGIGLSAARTFAENGAHVVVVGKDDEHVSSAEAVLGVQAVILTGDAVNPQTAVEAIEVCVRQFGGFNGLYHVAGGSGRKRGDGPLHELSLEGWESTLELNLTSVMLSNQAAVRQFLKQGTGGSVLNLGSVLGFSPSPQYFTTPAYAAAKAGIEGFTKSTAAYYAKNNIRFNAIAPGLVDTPMARRAASDETILSFIETKQPLDGGRIGRPADLDGLAIYFMSDMSSFTTGQVVAVDGGWTLSEGQYT